MTTMLNIKKGEKYTHGLFGQVTVLDIRRNTGEMKSHVTHIVVFQDAFNLTETQSLSGFKESVNYNQELWTNTVKSILPQRKIK